jgi:hypothetical protein
MMRMDGQPLEFDSTTDLANDPLAVRATRKPTLVQVRFADAAGVIETSEGPVRHDKGAAIITGGDGEQWPVERSRFAASYIAASPTLPFHDGTYRRQPDEVLARRIDRPFVLHMHGNRGTLHGQPGDWLVQYAQGEHGVVGAEIFETIYSPRPANGD